MKQKLIIFLILLFIILLFFNNNIIFTSSYTSYNLWLNKVFPYSFIMIILMDILIKLNITNYFKNTYLYIYFTSIFVGSPTSSIIIINLLKNKIIDKSSANICLMFSSFLNPLFLYTILSNIFNTSTTLIIMFINYLSNFLILLKYKKNLPLSKPRVSSSKINLSESIKLSINTNFLILGTLTFYLIICNILSNLFNLNIYLNTLLKGFLEVTNGLNNLNYLNHLKEYYAIFFISFQGLSIHTQVNSIIKEYDLDYKYFLKGRLLTFIISIILYSSLSLYLHP